VTRIGLIDYGAGNFASVRNALEHLAIELVEVREPDALQGTTHVILPGVGAFASAMNRLEELGLVEALAEHVLAQQKPFLGICVGMQVLASEGREFGVHPGLGFIDGVVDMIELPEGSGLGLPHIGWNELEVRQRSPLFDGMDGTPIFYFVHSYQLIPSDPEAIIATCNYGGLVVAAVRKGNVFGVQFHPEKSQHHGLQLLANFAAIDAGAPAPSTGA